MCGSCGANSRRIPNVRSISCPKPASAAGYGRPSREPGAALRIDGCGGAWFRSGAQMKIKDFLSASDVALDVPARDKVGLLKELAARAAYALGLSVDAVATEIEKRDELGSTGIGAGASIPHARFREGK